MKCRRGKKERIGGEKRAYSRAGAMSVSCAAVTALVTVYVLYSEDLSE
jgi:hypothetical protein